jgi:hypothetical protein
MGTLTTTWIGAKRIAFSIYLYQCGMKPKGIKIHKLVVHRIWGGIILCLLVGNLDTVKPSFIIYRKLDSLITWLHDNLGCLVINPSNIIPAFFPN